MAYVRTTVDEWAVQGDYNFGHGWEDLTVETSRKEAVERRREYRENEPGTRLRIVKRRVKIEQRIQQATP